MENQPNIISNELDQVSKSGDRYLKRLQDPELKKQGKSFYTIPQKKHKRGI